MLYGFAVCVLEVHVVDTPWKLWLELRTMTMEGLKTVVESENVVGGGADDVVDDINGNVASVRAF